MNLSALTAKEVMRICQPETELERRLYEIVSEIQSDIDQAYEERDNAVDALENDSVSMDDWSDLKAAIRKSIELIDCGKVGDARIILDAEV